MGKKKNIELTENQLDNIKSEILQCKSNMEDNILTIGNLLLKVKSALGHGYFGEWLENEVEFSATSAKRFMRIAKEFKDNPKLIDLGKSKVFALLGIEKEYREDFVNNTHTINGKEKTVDEMSVRELNQIIKKNKQSRKPISNITIKHLTLRSQGKCEICGWGGQGLEGILVPHHIHKYCNTQDNTSENLVMICPNCHGIIHTLENCKDKYIKDIIFNSLDEGVKNIIIKYLEILENEVIINE